MHFSFRKSLLIGSVISLALVILTGVLGVIMFQRQAKQAEWIMHTYRVLNSIKDVDNAVKDSRAARRSYRGTGDAKYLEDYKISLKNLESSKTELRHLVKDNRKQAILNRKLEADVERFIAYSESIPMNLRDFPETTRHKVINTETSLMNIVKSDITGLTLNERRLLGESIASNKELINLVVTILILSIAITLSIVITLITIVLREFKRRLRFQQELKDRYRELRKLAMEKEEVNKQLERFSFVVAHDLKSPLSGVIGAAELLSTDDRLTQYEDIRMMAGLMYDTTTKLSDRIASVLDYSRTSRDKQKIEEVNVKKLVDNIIYFLYPPRHIEVFVHEDLPVIDTQKTKLQQVFQNLISNAIKYNDKEKGYIEIGGSETGDFYKFYVKDNGPGIRDEDKDRIFGLFETTDNESAGETSTGIGLNLLKTLVEEQGGEIWVESNTGEGSTFYFMWHK